MIDNWKNKEELIRFNFRLQRQQKESATRKLKDDPHLLFH